MITFVPYDITMQKAITSPKIYARLAGIFYLINIVFGLFSIGYVESKIVVDGNAAATSTNIMTHEFLFRLGIVAHIIILLTNFPLALIFYRLFWVVNKNAALLVVFFTLVGTSVEAANLLNQFGPLVILESGSQAANALSQEQIYNQVYSLLRLNNIGFNLAIIFYAFYDLTAGYLIFKCAFLPKIIGVLLAIGGICYLTSSFSSFLAPGLAALLVPYIQIPSGLGELTFCLWLLIAGVNSKKWKEQEQVALP